MIKKEFYFEQNNNDKFSFSPVQILTKFGGGPLPLIWMFNGIYRIVRKETIANLIEIAEMCEKLNKIEKTVHKSRIYWHESISLASNAAKILVSGDVDA